MTSRRNLAKRLVRMSRLELLLLVEAAVSLLAARAVLGVVPFSRIGKYLGRLQPPAPGIDSALVGDAQTAKEIRWVIHAVAERFPFQVVCLPRALAAWLMLRRRSVPSRLHFGAPRSRDTSRPAMQTHAWLTSSGVEVTGYPVARDCVEIGFFSRESRQPAAHAASTAADRVWPEQKGA